MKRNMWMIGSVVLGLSLAACGGSDGGGTADAGPVADTGASTGAGSWHLESSRESALVA